MTDEPNYIRVVSNAKRTEFQLRMEDASGEALTAYTPMTRDQVRFVIAGCVDPKSRVDDRGATEIDDYRMTITDDVLLRARLRTF